MVLKLPKKGSVEWIGLGRFSSLLAGCELGVVHVGPTRAKHFAFQLMDEDTAEITRALKDREGHTIESRPDLFERHMTTEGMREQVKISSEIFKETVAGVRGTDAAEDDKAAALEALEQLSVAGMQLLCQEIIARQYLTREQFPAAPDPRYVEPAPVPVAPS